MRLLRKLHKWLGLIVGLQILLWTVSGLMFAWLDHRTVMGQHDIVRVESPALPPGLRLTEPAEWLGEYAAAEVHEIRLAALLDRWIWRVELADRVDLRDAEEGARLHLTEDLVRQLALAHYAGKGNLAAVTHQATPGLEARKAGPVWRAQFDDPGRTALYFAADDGRLVVARNTTWRVFDFFWMLHTMDYQGRDNFNNPLVIAFGTAALWLSISGLILLLRSFRLV